MRKNVNYKYMIYLFIRYRICEITSMKFLKNNMSLYTPTF